MSGSVDGADASESKMQHDGGSAGKRARAPKAAKPKMKESPVVYDEASKIWFFVNSEGSMESLGSFRNERQALKAYNERQQEREMFNNLSSFDSVTPDLKDIKDDDIIEEFSDDLNFF